MWRLRLMQKELSDRFWFWLAWALPRKVVYMSAIRLWAHGTTGNYGSTIVTDLTVDEAIDRWGQE